MTRLRHGLLWAGSLLLAGISVLILAILFLLGTESGSRRSLNLFITVLAGHSAYQLETGKVTGTFLHGLRLQDVRLRNPAQPLELTLPLLEFAWQPWQLLHGTLRIEELLVQGMHLQAQSVASPLSAALTRQGVSNLFALLPFTLELGSASASDLTILLDGKQLTLPLLQLTGSVHQKELVLDSLVLDMADAHVDGDLRLQSDLMLSGRLNWSYATAEEYAGALVLAGDLANIQVQHGLLTPFEMSSSGVISTGLFENTRPTLDLQHELAELNLAHFGQPQLTIATAAITTSGDIRNLIIDATLNLQAYEFAPAQLTLSAVYTPELVELLALNVSSAELNADISGTYTTALRSLDLDWALEELSLERYPTQVRLTGLAGSGNVALTATDAGINAVVRLGFLQGLLNGNPLALAGTLAIRDAALESMNLQLTNGGNLFQLQGTVTPALALEWTLAAPEMAGLWNGLSGSLDGAGAVSGTRSAPLLSGQLQGESLALAYGDAEFMLEKLALTATVTGERNSLELQLNGVDISRSGVQKQWLQSGVMQLDGTLQEHRLTAQLQGLDSTLELAMTGQRTDAGWRGALQTADFLSSFGDWTLMQAGSLQAESGVFQFNRHCWEQGSMELCAEATKMAALDARVELTGLPLRWLNPLAQQPDKPEGLQQLQADFGFILPQGLQVNGTADLDVRLLGLREGEWRQIQATVQPWELELELARNEDAEVVEAEHIEVEGGEAESGEATQRFRFIEPIFSLENDGRLWSGKLGFGIAQAGTDSGAGAVQPEGTFSAELGMDQDERLQGAFALNFPDLSWFETLVPVLREVSGELYGSGTLAGTRTEPELTAQIQIGKGAFALPEYGLQISGIELALASSREQAVVNVSALTTNSGSLLMQANIQRPLGDDRSFTAHIEGADFLLLATEAATVKVSPDLDISYNQNALDISGRLRVPEAAIDLDAWLAVAGTGSVNTSRDVVIAAGDPEASLGVARQVLPLSARLQLELGDAVNLKGYGMDARLNGELTLEQNPERPLLAYGELGIPSGTYRIYKQQLELRDGRLLFFGNPLNPVLDVRAFRETTRAEVGMMLSGSLASIKGTLYSTPVLPDNEVLAMLITGKTFNNMNDQDGNALVSAIASFGIERGEGLSSMIGKQLGLDAVSINNEGSSYLDSSLGLGKYLTPDLLMRYEIGMFDRRAVFSIDYTLSESIKLEVRTGDSQSVDISYTIEKE